MANLLESVMGAFGPDLISKAASALGESESGVTKAIGAAVPSLLSGIMSSAKSDGGANLFNLAKQAADSGILGNLGNMFGGSGSSNLMSMGTSMLSGLLGNKAMGLTSLLSTFTGMKSSSIGSILSAVAPVALSFIGKHALSNNLSASGIMSWLTGQKSAITSAMPAGLNVSSLFDGGAAQSVESATRKLVTEPEKPATNWLWPLIAALVGLALLWYFMRGCNAKEEVAAAVDTVAVTPPVVETPPVVVRESFKVKLPDGVELDAYKGGIEDKLVAFLNDPASVAGKDVWFDFDNLNFETGSAKITAESQTQINNIAAILKAYPKLKIKIGGYTDKSGQADANKALSQSRADAVLAALKATGASVAQLTGAEGYGSEFAKVPAEASDEERRVDRRISVGVREK